MNQTRKNISIMTTKVIASLIQKDSKVLIAQRAKKDSLFGKWEFPGGKMEPGETEHECLKRELFEEFGIHANIGTYFCSSFFKHNQNDFEMRAYHVPSFTGNFTLHDHLEIRWVSIEELPLYDMPEPDKPIVEKLIKKGHTN